MVKRYLFAITFVLGVTSLLGQGGRRAAIAAGKTTDERIAYYSARTAEHPQDSHSRVLLALEYLQKLRETGDGKYLKLAAGTVDAISDEEDNTEALRVQNEVQLQLHQFRSVATRAQRLVAINPSDTGSWGNLGDALMELGEYEKAGEAYKKMLTLHPNLSSYNRAAYFHFVTGQPATAITLMQNAIESGGQVAEQVAWCWSELGDMYFKTGSMPLAFSAYNTAIKLQPTLHRAHAGLGRLQWIDEKRAEAIQSFKRAQAVVPLPEYASALEDLYAETGDAKEAHNQHQMLEALTKMAKISGENANRVLALIYVDHGSRLEEALALVQNEFENRDDVYTYDALAWVLYSLKRFPEAEAAAAKAVKYGTPEPVFLFHAGMIAASLNKPDQAKKFLEGALSLNQKFDRKMAPLARRTLESLNPRNG